MDLEFESLLGGRAADLYPTFARLREDSPVLWSPMANAWVITRWSDVTRCVQDAEVFEPVPAATGSAGTNSIFGRTLIHMSGDEHRRKAAIIAKRLRGPRILKTELRELVSDIVGECAASLACAPEVADVKACLTSPVPLQVICELMALQDVAEFAEWFHGVVGASNSNVTRDPDRHARGEAARSEICHMV
ncbi:MAG: hypothetical protein WCK21_09065, partial [Actinomycetota bacterium]